jgi:hypothetical protein
MSTVRSNVRTKSTESEQKRDVFTDQRVKGRATRAEFSTSEPLIEYIRPSGGPLKWCSLYFGGESRAGY